MQKISDFFPWNENTNLFQQQFVACYDNNSGSGEFSFVYTLLKLLKDGANIDLICCNHDRNHYESILRKNNLDLNRLESSGRVIINLLCVPISAVVCKKSVRWEQLVELYDSPGSTNERQFSLMIDDVDAFEMIAESPKTARLFLSSVLRKMSAKSPMRSIVAFGRQPLETLTQFTSLSESDQVAERWKIPTGQNALGASRYNYPLDETTAEPSLAEYLRYRADIMITVSALESGYSSAVHGLIAVTQPSKGVKRQTLQYKALDSGVMCSIVGDSRIQQQT